MLGARQDRGRRERVKLLAPVLCLMITVGVLGVTPPSAPAARGGAHLRPLCARYECVTLMADAQVRVFQARERRVSEGAFRSTYARWLPSGRVTALGDSAFAFAGSALEALALNGRFVAYALGGAERSPGAGRGEAVYRLDANSGRRTQVSCSGGSERTCGIAANEPGVTDMAVTSAGSVAWIVGGARSSTPFAVQPFAVYLLAAHAASATQLAASASISPHSLAAISGHVYWLEGETARQAPAE
jgi:hypothetical protein